jgi:hypothetical protein
VTSPLARSEDLVVEEMGGDVLVYDLRVDRAHALRAEAARVWRCCDGRTTAEGLAAAAGVDGETAARALAELEACDLLEGAPGRARDSTRREAGVKLARVAGAAAVAPLIASLAVPATAAASATDATCNADTTGCVGTDPSQPDCQAKPGCCCCVDLANPPAFCVDGLPCCVTRITCQNAAGVCV